MFCGKCGKEIPDTVKFCAYCGSPVAPADPGASQMPAAAMSAAENEIPDEEATIRETRHKEDTRGTSAGGQPEHTGAGGGPDEQVQKVSLKKPDASEENSAAAAADPSPVVQGENTADTNQGTMPMLMPVVPLGAGTDGPQGMGDSQGMQPARSGKKHRVAVWGVIGVIAVALVGCMAFLLRGFLGSGGDKDHLFYIKDGELACILDITSKEPEEVNIEKIRNADEAYDGYLADYSEDGKYLYYFSKVDEEGDYGTLNCLQADKIKKDESANSSCIKEIDSRVKVGGFQIIDSASVIYLRKDNELWFYHNGETEQLADSVVDFKVTDDQKYVIYLEGEENEDEDDGEDADYTLYAAGLTKGAKAEEIDSHVNGVAKADNSDFILYSKDYDEENETADCYVAGVNTSAKLAAEDVCDVWEGDRGFYYAKRESRQVPLYDYVIDPDVESEADREEPDVRDYMRSVSAAEAISETDLNYYSSMDEFLESEVLSEWNYDEESELYTYWNSDEYEYYYYDDRTGEWYGSFDEEAYEESVNDYESIAYRDELREELKAETAEQSYYSVHYYQNGNNSVVCENVESMKTSTGRGIIYTKASLDSVEKKYPMDEIYSTDDVRSAVEEEYWTDDTEKEVCYCSIDGSGEEELRAFDTISGMYLSEDAKTLIVTGNEEEGSEIIAYKVQKDGLEEAESLSKQGTACGFHENIFYYFDDISDSEGDLCRYDGSKKIVAKNASIGKGIFIADDGTVTGVTDWDTEHLDGKLAVYDKDGSDQNVLKDISDFTYLGGGTYLVVQDDDLYYLNKKGEKTRLARHVDYYWFRGAEQGYQVSGYVIG